MSNNSKKWKTETQTLILLACFGSGLGAIFDSALLGLSLVLLTYSIWNILNLKSIDDWLAVTGQDNTQQPVPPDTRGIWGDIFDHLYRYQRNAIAMRNNMQALIDRGHASVSALKDGILITDHHGNLEFWNTSLGQIMGFRYPDDIGLPLTNLFRDPRLKTYFDSKQYHESLILPSPRNEQATLEIQITLFGDDERLFVIRDVSRLHNLERMRTDFVANISHELRTPLTVLKGYLETLNDQEQVPATLLRKATHSMMEQSDRMEALVNDLLMLARLETKDKANPTVVPIHSLLNSICEGAHNLAKKCEQTIKLESTETLNLFATEQEIHSAFSNLINNALKYSGKDACITVRWWVDNDGAHLQVKDNGIGISPEHLPRLTERFYRIDQSRQATTGGTGLGLAIVKHVMMRHSGSLEISSRHSKGSVFTCHFPISLVRHTDGSDQWQATDSQTSSPPLTLTPRQNTQATVLEFLPNEIKRSSEN